ncbi:aminotransferase class IV [Spirosoma aerophilum]
MFLVYNSDILPESDFRLSENDRAFQYGDGLFETIRYESNRIWFWHDHFSRLSAGMSAMQLAFPDDFITETLEEVILHLLEANELTDQSTRIKLQVWRQSGGLYTPATNQAHMLITVRPGHSFSITDKARTAVYDDFRLSPSPVSAFKTLNALPYVLAGIYKNQHNLDDVILLDTHGHLAECLASSLFWYINQTLFTPSLQTGCINGIVRQQLLRLALNHGITIKEGLYKPDVLLKAEAVFCANVMGIQWLNQVDQSVIYPSVKVKQQLALLFSHLHR